MGSSIHRRKQILLHMKLISIFTLISTQLMSMNPQILPQSQISLRNKMQGPWGRLPSFLWRLLLLQEEHLLRLQVIVGIAMNQRWRVSPVHRLKKLNSQIPNLVSNSMTNSKTQNTAHRFPRMSHQNRVPCFMLKLRQSLKNYLSQHRQLLQPSRLNLSLRLPSFIPPTIRIISHYHQFHH